MTDRDEFSGRSALITGGTRGIGKGIADRLRAGGARVLVAARCLQGVGAEHGPPNLTAALLTPKGLVVLESAGT